jgi:hypothetical protein
MRLFTPTLVAAVAISTSACASGGASPTPAPPAVASPCHPDDDTCRVERLGDTSFGWLKGGLPISALAARLGAPEHVGETFEEGATGDVIHERSYPSAGVVVTAVKSGDEEHVRDFTLSAPFAEKSARGVGIGSSEAEVLAAYADCLEGFSTVPGEKAVAGTVFGGVFFFFEDGVVTSIFVGAGAE